MDSLAAMTFPGFLPDWSNLAVLHNNTLPARAHFYSYATEEAALSFDREQSQFQSLNGTWKFHYDDSPFEAPLWESADVESWDDIEVPGVWQLQGDDYGSPHYTNIDYPFPVTPPNVSYVNPTGSYWREFEVPSDWDGQQIRLRYEGVDSAFHVWINGEEVGYSQGARNPSEFDITDYLSASEGETNTIATRVYKWSDGSYLEDQDQWWMSGIFRDVYLVPFPRSSIVDFSVVPEVHDSLKTGTLRANFTIQGEDGEVEVKVRSPNGTVIDKWSGPSSERYAREFSGDDLELWSAESPSLYTMLITFNGRTISQKVGFRRIEKSGPNFLVNGEPIIIYGVNRHEHHPLSGRTVPYEAMRADLIRMKRSNINTIRTAHQPPHPSFFDVADELGFYVIAEADLECHGFTTIEGGSEENAAKWLSDNPDWEHAYLDRAEQLVERFKNHASVIIWSLGNECFYGQNQAAMYKWIKETDPTRVIHYEQDREAESADMYSHMYSSPDDVLEHIRNYTDKSLILCEFAHAMGNGPGGLLEYIELFRREPLLQGGLVWEWSNHGLLKKEDNVTYYAYGGDFGDEPNDADFIMDGLLLSDHTPMPSLAEYAKVIQPVTVKLTEDSSQLIITNHYDFVDLSGLNPLWYIVQDGKSNTEPQQLKLPRVPAGENRTVDLPLDAEDLSQEAWLTVEFQLSEDKTWAEKGHVVAWDQVYISGPSVARQQRARRAFSPAPRQEAGIQINRPKPTQLQVQTGSSTVGFDLLRGNVTWNINGVDLFQRGPELYFYRAMTQNDEGQSGDMAEWENAQVATMHTQVRDVTWEQSDEALTVHYKVRVAPMVLEWGVEADLIYTISAAESSPLFSLQARGEFVGKNTPSVIPRIGLQAVLPLEFDQVAWFGRGPGENYKDSKQASAFGRYESSVPDLFTHYDYPQENGNREDLRWVQIGTAGNSSEGVTLDARRTGNGGNNESEPLPFSFTARHYMPFDLDDAQHPHDLKPLDFTVLNLDYDNHGLGSASVGPKPFEQYKCKTDPFDFAFEFNIV